MSGNPLQGNIIDYFSFINPDLLNKDSDQYVVRNSVYLNSPLDSDYIVKKKDFLDKKTFDEVNKDDKVQELKFVNFGSEDDYLERYNFIFIDGILGGGFKPSTIDKK
jgi:CTP:phosphocholine cytidylyltransferase-like protein